MKVNIKKIKLIVEILLNELKHFNFDNNKINIPKKNKNKHSHTHNILLIALFLSVISILYMFCINALT